jgi:hypothetical protein
MKLGCSEHQNAHGLHYERFVAVGLWAAVLGAAPTSAHERFIRFNRSVQLRFVTTNTATDASQNEQRRLVSDLRLAGEL